MATAATLAGYDFAAATFVEYNCTAATLYNTIVLYKCGCISNCILKV